MQAVVEVDGIGRVYTFAARPGMRREKKTTVTALDDVSMTVGRGEVIGLLGPNGAGKTTLIKILCTVLLPTSGSARVCGYDVVRQPQQVRRRTGLVFGGERGLYGRLTVRDNLDYWAAMYHVPRRVRSSRIPALLELTGMADKARTPVDRLSRGMKQRLHVARGLLNDPDLVFMDEPTSGMDPVGARQFRVLVERLRGDGRTTLLATHDMAEAEELCDRVVLIDRGRIIGIEPPKTIGQLLVKHARVDAAQVDPCVLARLERLPGVGAVERLADDWQRIQTSSDEAVAAVLRLLIDSGHTSVRTSFPSLEEVYLHFIDGRR